MLLLGATTAGHAPLGGIARRRKPTEGRGLHLVVEHALERALKALLKLRRRRPILPLDLPKRRLGQALQKELDPDAVAQPKARHRRLLSPLTVAGLLTHNNVARHALICLDQSLSRNVTKSSFSVGPDH